MILLILRLFLVRKHFLYSLIEDITFHHHDSLPNLFLEIIQFFYCLHYVAFTNIRIENIRSLFNLAIISNYVNASHFSFVELFDVYFER